MIVVLLTFKNNIMLRIIKLRTIAYIKKLSNVRQEPN